MKSPSFRGFSFKIREYVKPFSFMNVLFNLIVLALILNFLSVIIILPFIHTYDEVDKFMKLFWPIIVFQLSALGFVYNIRRHSSEDYYKEAKEQLCKAYETLNHFKDGQLDNDRLRWLTTARMLSVSTTISKKIMMSSHKVMYKEEKQFWRLKFADLVIDFPSTFYAESPKHLIMHAEHERAPIAEDSLVEIYNFMKWPEDYVDPLHNKKFTMEEIERMTTRGPRGLGNLLKAHRALVKKS